MRWLNIRAKWVGCAVLQIILMAGNTAFAQLGANADYAFDGKISRNVLTHYLDRAMTIQSLLVGKGNFDDNLRMIKKTGVKFIGRAVCQWGQEAGIADNLKKEKQLAERVHAVDPDIILQACIFEIVTPEVNQITVPGWAFRAFGLRREARNFRYEDMLYSDGRFKNQWGKGSVPDISKQETRLFFYYLAVCYIDEGIEGLHFGQVELMNKNDSNLDYYAQLLLLIRKYAHAHARRHMIICDAHVPGGGFVKDGKLLLDVHAFPLRIAESAGNPEKAHLAVGHTDALYLRSKGGITPSGWACDHLPYLVEFDNYGISKHPGHENAGGIPFWVWGFDEISWFARQSDQYRHYWLSYAYNWIRDTDPNGHLEMPGGRQTTFPGEGSQRKWYYANYPSKLVPEGTGDEAVIRDIWKNK